MQASKNDRVSITTHTAVPAQQKCSSVADLGKMGHQ